MKLPELIRAMKGDRTYHDLAAAAGGSPGWKRWEQMVNRPLAGFTDPATITNIARALGVTEDTVVKACCESLGIEVRDSGSLLASMVSSIPGTERITDDEVRAIVALVRVAAARAPQEIEPDPVPVRKVAVKAPVKAPVKRASPRR
jgi:hypothetical protein